MKSLVKSLIAPFLTEIDSLPEEKTVGLFGGGFQPPTKGHLDVVKKAIKMYPKLDKFIIYVGTGGGRSENITQAQALAIWDIYKEYLPSYVEIEPSSNPVSSIYRYAKEHPFEDVKWFLGSRQGNDQDFQDFHKRSKATSTRDNLEAINVVTNIEVSGTKARQALDSKEDFFTYLPDELSDVEKEAVFNILKPSINEMVPEPEIDDIDDYADDVLDPIDLEIPPHFVDRVNDKRNRPEIETDELYDFFDKLADEKDELLSLLDKGEEIVATDSDTDINIPLAKDSFKSKRKNQPVVVAKTIMRKRDFATPNKKLTFEQIQGDSIVCDNCGWTWKIADGGDDLYICHKCGHDNTPTENSNDFFEPLKGEDTPQPEVKQQGLENDSEFKELLVSLTMYMMDHINIEPLPDLIFVEDDTENAKNILGTTAYYNPDNKSITLYTYGRHPKDILRSYAHEMIHHKQNLEGRLTGIQGQNINQDDHLKELEAEAYTYGNGLLFRGWENSL